MIPRIHYYPNPHTSETAGEFESIVDALETDPSPGAELAANGVVLAEVFGFEGRLGWHVTKAGIQRFREEQKP